MIYRLKKDLQLRARAQRAFPAGVYGHMKSAHLSPAHPQFFARADGGRLWDVDGNEYIDFMCGYGTNLLGYNHPKVDEAARRQQALADCTTAPSPLMLELAETFTDIVAHADWTMFAKNGSDATTICVMTARAQTGRHTILVADGAYHGADAWCRTPGVVGVTDGDCANKLSFTYNDIESLNAAVDQAGEDLAAIIVTPYKHDVIAGEDQQWPTQAFAQTVRTLCDQKGAALILDDVRCAFRFSTGSTWETIDVLPDLCAMSKSVANGYALSVVTGNDMYRQGASQIVTTGSFWFASVAFAASLATIAAIEEEGVIDTIASSGELLRNGLNELASSYNVTLRQTGPVQMPLILIDDDPTWEKNKFFCHQAVLRGVYLNPWHNMFVCAAHDQDTIQEALNRMAGAFETLKKQFCEA